jgi:hypothetical protein
MELEIGFVCCSDSFWSNIGKLSGYEHSDYYAGKIIMYRGELLVLNPDSKS